MKQNEGEINAETRLYPKGAVSYNINYNLNKNFRNKIQYYT